MEDDFTDRIVEREDLAPAVGVAHEPDHTAAIELERGNIEVQPDEGFRIEPAFGTLNKQMRPTGAVRAPQVQIIGHNAAVPAKPHLAEVHFPTLDAHLINQPLLHEFRQPDLIEKKGAHYDGENQEDEADSQRAEANAAGAFPARGGRASLPIGGPGFHD